MTMWDFMVSLAESEKGVNAVQRCSIENQKGAIAVDFGQRYHPSASQQDIFEQCSNALLALNWRYIHTMLDYDT